MAKLPPPPAGEFALDLQIEYVDPESLVLAEYNPREITETALTRLGQVLDRHGWIDPVIARREDRLVIGGHQRLRANRLRAHPDRTVPTIFLAGLSDDRAKALNIALNNPRVQGTFDLVKLANILVEIDTGTIDVPALTGFADIEIVGLVHDVDARQHAPDGNLTLDNAPVTEEDIQRAKDRLAKDIAAGQGKVNVMCPHCGKEFMIEAGLT